MPILPIADLSRFPVPVSQMDRLAQLIAWTSASNPADFVDRLEVWDGEIRQQWEDRGYKAGLEAASSVYGLSLDDSY